LNDSTSATEGYRPIGDYALIGDCRAAGLISRDGSLDWLRFPRFDSPSIFGALLDRESGGRFRIRPTGTFESGRRYMPDTNILETTFRTSTGSFVLRDLMPVSSEAEKRSELAPDHQVLRELEGLDGEVEVEVLYEPRPDYGRFRPRLEDRGRLGLWTDANRAALVLRSELDVRPTSDGQAARGVAVIRVGERRYLSFSYAEEAPQVVPPLGEVARARVERSARWWRGSAQRAGAEADGLRAIWRRRGCADDFVA
jgi:GH15 family glucan-1,4-alpha-glucosidase